MGRSVCSADSRDFTDALRQIRDASEAGRPLDSFLDDDNLFGSLTRSMVALLGFVLFGRDEQMFKAFEQSIGMELAGAQTAEPRCAEAASDLVELLTKKESLQRRFFKLRERIRTEMRQLATD